ncbi:MAG TPA: hypothetical protein VJZ00_11240 [Thermoanaerobaculia bacterium]|nr:hypothetical protein [Thermoanaerobaculia bacterium]
MNPHRLPQTGRHDLAQNADGIFVVTVLPRLRKALVVRQTPEEVARRIERRRVVRRVSNDLGEGRDDVAVRRRYERCIGAGLFGRGRELEGELRQLEHLPRKEVPHFLQSAQHLSSFGVRRGFERRDD